MTTPLSGLHPQLLREEEELGSAKIIFPSLMFTCSYSEKALAGTPLQDSCLENPMDGGAWQAAVRGVAKSRTRLSNFSFTFHFCALEKEMATQSSVLAWRVPGTGEPGGCHFWGRTESDTTEVT